jgi:hypothetical protein
LGNILDYRRGTLNIDNTYAKTKMGKGIPNGNSSEHFIGIPMIVRRMVA